MMDAPTQPMTGEEDMAILGIIGIGFVTLTMFAAVSLYFADHRDKQLRRLNYQVEQLRTELMSPEEVRQLTHRREALEDRTRKLLQLSDL
jgi:hypothetical protein